MGFPSTAPCLPDLPFPDLFIGHAQRIPHAPLVQVIKEQSDASSGRTYFTWIEVLNHARIVALDLSTRWALRASDPSVEEAARAREAGAPLVVVGVMANSGYDLYVNILACLINRWSVLLISSKNSPAAIEHLLRTTDSRLFLVDSSNLSLGRTMEDNIPGLQSQAVTYLESCALDSVPQHDSEPTQSQLQDELNRPALYLHTSGSTGHPKVIPWSHRFILSKARARQADGDGWIGLPIYTMAPLIHAMGVVTCLIWPMAHTTIATFVSSPTPKPPSASSLLSYLRFIQGGCLVVPPSILEDLHGLGGAAVAEVAKYISLVIFVGAPLSPATGNDLVAAGMKITTSYGSTEIGVCSPLRLTKQPDHWEYVSFREGYTWHFLPVDNHSNLRALIVGPGENDSPAVLNHEDPLGFITNDVWEPHPTVPNLWKHHSRVGDVTVLSNGEKADNKQVENLLLRDKRIRYVQVFGAGRSMIGILIQPADPSVSSSEFLTQIEQTISEANSVLPKHSRLLPELIVVVPRDRPFATTDKGTVKKKETLDRFEEEIDRAYLSFEDGSGVFPWVFEGTVEEVDIKQFIQTVVKDMLGDGVPEDGDLFEYGLDSLLSMRLRRALMSILAKIPNCPQQLPRNIAYTCPSIASLAKYLWAHAEPGASASVSRLRNETDGDAKATIRAMISRHTANFAHHEPEPGVDKVRGKVVALSGSTGSLGSSILDLLLKRGDDDDDVVEKIYLLNRKGAESQKIRHEKAFREKGMDPLVLEERRGKIVYLDVDLSRKDLGLSDADYDELRVNVTHIIHGAWRLDFNLVLESYERVHVAGVRHLADLALSSPHAHTPRLVFLSTIAAAAAFRGPSQPPSTGETAPGQVLVPEKPLDDPGVALEQGYAQSKFVGERVLDGAASFGLCASVVRIGQLSGVTRGGAWSANEYIPIMIRTSLALGEVPVDLPPVRWVPTDIAASIVIRQTFGAPSSSKLEYFSIENPFPTPWNTVVQALSAKSQTPLRGITPLAWVEHVKNSDQDPTNLPAKKLLDFYEKNFADGERQQQQQQLGGGVALSWDKSIKFAPELTSNLITSSLVERYVEFQRGKVGGGV